MRCYTEVAKRRIDVYFLFFNRRLNFINIVRGAFCVESVVSVLCA